MEPSSLAKEFAEAVAAQDGEIARGDPKRGNEFATKYVQAAHQLLMLGPAGIEAFTALLQDERQSVRVQAAYYLLPFRTHESLKVLEIVARSKGTSALGAVMTLARWKGGEKTMWEEIERISKYAKLPKPRTELGTS